MCSHNFRIFLPNCFLSKLRFAQTLYSFLCLHIIWNLNVTLQTPLPNSYKVAFLMSYVSVTLSLICSSPGLLISTKQIHRYKKYTYTQSRGEGDRKASPYSTRTFGPPGDDLPRYINVLCLLYILCNRYSCSILLHHYTSEIILKTLSY